MSAFVSSLIYLPACAAARRLERFSIDPLPIRYLSSATQDVVELGMGLVVPGILSNFICLPGDHQASYSKRDFAGLCPKCR